MLGFSSLGRAALGEIPVTATAYVLSIEAGSFTLTGVSAGLTATRRLTAGTGVFVLSGATAVLSKTYIPAAMSAGSFVVSGQSASLTVARYIYASPIEAPESGFVGFAALGEVALGQTTPNNATTFSVAGQPIALRATRRIALEAGSFAFTGNVVTLSKRVSMSASVGAFVLTGSAAGLTATRILRANTGTFGETGTVVEFTRRKRGLRVSAGGGAVGMRIRA